MRDLKPPKKVLRPIPKLPFLRLSAPSGPGRAEFNFRLSKAARIFLGAGATSLVAALVIGSFSASGVIDMTLAITLLAAAWLIGMGAIVVAEPILVPPRIRWPATGVAAVVLAAALAGLGFYENKHFPLAPIKEGAHLISTLSPLKKGDTKIVVTVENKGDLIARIRSENGQDWVIVDHRLSEREEDYYYAQAKAALPLIGTGLDLPRDTARTFNIDLPFADSQIDEVAAGTKYLYLFFVIAFTDATSNASEHFVGTLCGKYFKYLDAPTACLGHNKSRAPG